MRVTDDAGVGDGALFSSLCESFLLLWSLVNIPVKILREMIFKRLKGRGY